MNDGYFWLIFNVIDVSVRCESVKNRTQMIIPLIQGVFIHTSTRDILPN
jgi:hypothetical protein